MAKMKFPYQMIALAAIMVTSGPASAEDDVARPDVLKMKMSQIRAHNASLDKQHRFFIRCQTDVVTGSLSKRVRTCRTREDWDKMARNAQQFLNDAVDKGLQSPTPSPEQMGGG